MREKRSQKRETWLTAMPPTADIVHDEMRGHVRGIVDLSTDSRKAALAFAAKVLRLPFSRVKKLYYGEPLAVRAHEADQIRAFAEAASQLIKARAEYESKRAAFLAEAHPTLARLVPPPLVGEEVSEKVAESTVARERGR